MTPPPLPPPQELGGPNPLYPDPTQLRLGRLQPSAELRQLTGRLSQLQLQPQPLSARLARRVTEQLRQLWPSGGSEPGWQQAAQVRGRHEACGCSSGRKTLGRGWMDENYLAASFVIIKFTNDSLKHVAISPAPSQHKPAFSIVA